MNSYGAPTSEQALPEYESGTTTTSASAVKQGRGILVLGTVDSTTIKASQTIVGYTVPKARTASTVVTFNRGTATTSKKVGQIPTGWKEGDGTIISGTAANKATEAGLDAYPGGIVDRVAKLSDGEYDVHMIGVN